MSYSQEIYDAVRSRTPPMTEREKVLAPCPLCGKAVQFRKALWPSDGNVDAIIHAEPTDCGMVDYSTGTTDESVIAKWNALPRATTGEMVKLADVFTALEESISETEVWGEESAKLLRRMLGKIRALPRAALATLKDHGHD